jgi:hypothetical protein
MGTINTRISIRSSNTFRNNLSQRHDRVYAVESRIDNATRIIKATTTGTAYTIVDGADFYDAAETGDAANRVYLFVRNTSGIAGKIITVQFNDGTNTVETAKLNAGEFTMITWYCGSANHAVEVYSNDSAGVKVEFIASPMQ